MCEALGSIPAPKKKRQKKKKKEGEGGRERTMEEMNQTGVHYMDIWKSHNETTCTTIIN
jgi:hypothetical protein